LLVGATVCGGRRRPGDTPSNGANGDKLWIEPEWLNNSPTLLPRVEDGNLSNDGEELKALDEDDIFDAQQQQEINAAQQEEAVQAQLDAQEEFNAATQARFAPLQVQIDAQLQKIQGLRGAFSPAVIQALMETAVYYALSQSVVYEKEVMEEIPYSLCHKWAETF